jgi:hypothetical protein
LSGDFGVVLLLFTIGLHLRLGNLLRTEVLGVGSIHLLLSSLIFVPILLATGLNTKASMLLAVGLGFSSTVLTAKSLDARGELDTFHGRLAIGVLVLQDVVAVLLLAIAGADRPSLLALGLPALILLRPALHRLIRSAGHDELLLIFGLLMAVGVGTIFEAVGLDPKLGALAAGMLLAGDPRADELYERLWALKEVLLVGFFLNVGLGGLPDAQGMLLVLLLLLFLPLRSRSRWQPHPDRSAPLRDSSNNNPHDSDLISVPTLFRERRTARFVQWIERVHQSTNRRILWRQRACGFGGLSCGGHVTARLQELRQIGQRAGIGRLQALNLLRAKDRLVDLAIQSQRFHPAS